MDNTNWRRTQGVSGGPVGDPSMEVGDWRAQLTADARPRIVNKITEILKRHVPFSGHEGLQELKKIAARFEEKIYTAATSQSDYLRKISFKMATMETGSQNPMPDAMQANNGLNPLDPGNQEAIVQVAAPKVTQMMESGDWRVQLQADSRQRVVDKIVEILKRRIPFSGHEGLQELKKIAVGFEEKIYTAATSQSDYLRKISLKMLTMETGSQNPMPDAMQANDGLNPLDPGSMASGHQAPSISDTAIDNVSSGSREGAPSMESGDWRVQLQPDSRERIVNKIMETLKRRSPFFFSDEEALRDLKEIAMRFEEKIYTTSTSQSDYLRIISLKMLTMETGSQNPMPDTLQANNGLNPLDPEPTLRPCTTAQVERKTVEDARHFENEERMTRHEERMSRIEEQQACILALLQDLDRPSQPPVATTSAPVTTRAPVSHRYLRRTVSTSTTSTSHSDTPIVRNAESALPTDASIPSTHQ